MILAHPYSNVDSLMWLSRVRDEDVLQVLWAVTTT